MNSKATGWKYVLLPVLVLGFLSVYPLLQQSVVKGRWHGSYYVSNYDEVAYSAYVNGILNGAARRSDPFLNKDVEYESLYSIQFVPAYAIAAVSRVFSVSTQSAFVILGLLIAIASSIAVFRFLSDLTNDPAQASIGTLIVLCLGTACAFEGELRQLLFGRVLVDNLPFMRRYQPGFGFPLFFLFALCVWRSIRADNSKRLLTYSFASGLILFALVFTYFYLWTAALAWVCVLVVVGLVTGRSGLRQSLTLFLVVVICTGAATVPYFFLIINGSPEFDSVHLLTTSHTPDFGSPTLLIGLVVAALYILTIRKKAADVDRKTVFGISFALSPIVVFNQQVVTGHSLQPAHYDVFIANYLVLTSIVLLVSALIDRKNISPRIVQRGMAYVGIIAAIWGFVEVSRSTGRNAVAAEIRDESVPALNYIQKEIENNSRPAVVLATNFVTADFIPSICKARTLWNAHLTTAGGVNSAENKRLFYQYLYYSGYTDKDLAEALSNNTFEAVAAVFGPDRALPELTNGAKPISPSEIREAARQYASFVNSFDSQEASNPVLSYVIVPTDAPPDLANLDRWYSRDGGRAFGMFTVYRVTLKSL